MLEPKSTSGDNISLFIKVDSYNFREREIVVLKKDLPKTYSEATWLVLFIETESRIEHGKIVAINETLESIVFEVATWITHIDISVEGVFVAENFMTTKASLFEASSLSDLLVRSEVEVTVWRTLRRVSSDIIVELNSPLLTEECVVTAFIFASHRFLLQDNTLTIGEKIISENEILENPFHIVQAVQKLLN